MASTASWCPPGTRTPWPRRFKKYLAAPDLLRDQRQFALKKGRAIYHLERLAPNLQGIEKELIRA